MEKINLFCLPYAGGNKYSYRKYEDNAPDLLKIVPLEHPGRGGRIGEPLVTDLKVLVEDVYRQIKREVGKANYAFYGHSMGGLTACLLTRKLLEYGHPPPLHLFITGTSGPSALSRSSKKRHLLEKKEFIEEIRSLNGSPDEILDNEELLDYFEPILRADFEATENYIYEEEKPLDIPFTIITGTEEDMSPEDIGLWQKETNREADFRKMEGNHFFIFGHSGKILGIITEKLQKLYPKYSYI